MPRSVNAVASRARRKKSSTVQKVTGEEVKTYGQLPKINGKKVNNMHIVTENARKENFVRCGLTVSMQVAA